MNLIVVKYDFIGNKCVQYFYSDLLPEVEHPLEPGVEGHDLQGVGGGQDNTLGLTVTQGHSSNQVYNNNNIRHTGTQQQLGLQQQH